MKKLFLLLILTLNSLLLSAQKHFTIKGITMDSPYPTFMKEMEEKGLETIIKQDEGCAMKGQFAGKDATFFIIGTPKSKTVWRVRIDLEKKKEWSDLLDEFVEMTEHYTAKYGEPEKKFHYTVKPYEIGDGKEMEALKDKKILFVYFYNLDEGMISVEISKDQCISIKYEDKINTELKNSEKESVIADDI